MMIVRSPGMQLATGLDIDNIQSRQASVGRMQSQENNYMTEG
jgi:hypothetical protein